MRMVLRHNETSSVVDGSACGGGMVDLTWGRSFDLLWTSEFEGEEIETENNIGHDRGGRP
jgi:hypothetical protein